jgi:hypothetical protein
VTAKRSEVVRAELAESEHQTIGGAAALVQLERYAPTSSNVANSLQFLERLEAVLASS